MVLYAVFISYQGSYWILKRVICSCDLKRITSSTLYEMYIGICTVIAFYQYTSTLMVLAVKITRNVWLTLYKDTQ